MTKQICLICVENINKTNRKPIICPYCDFTCCRECTKRHITNGAMDPFCMEPSCKRIWTQEFVQQNMTNVFFNKEYKDYRANLILEKQKGLLPASQYIIQEKKEKRKNEKLIKVLVDKKQEIKNIANEKINEIDLQISELQKSNTKKKRDKRFIKSCSRDDCRGFLSSSWKCGTCNRYTCSDCHEPKNGRVDEDHVCDKDAVETVKFLVIDTRPCPKCAIPIHKIDGCDQIFCVQCGTAFSWNHGTIETGRIHNPHYYEWQRQRNNGEAPRVDGDIPCGGLPMPQEVNPFINRLSRTHIVENSKSFLENYPLHLIYRIIQHIQEIELPRFPLVTTEEDLDLDLRVEYLEDNICEKKWKQILKTRTKRREKNQEVNAILNTYVFISSELFRGVLEKHLVTDVKQFYDEQLELRDYINKTLKEVGKRFGNKVPMITQGWETVVNQ
jgi:hypothetical protein